MTERERTRSDIQGVGHGSCHDWSRDVTGYFLGQIGTSYFCDSCRSGFVHLYHLTPDICEAMERSGVPDSCTPRVTVDD